MSRAAPERERHATGVPGLDAVLGGGLQRGALVLLAGPAGSGKTTLAGQIASNAARAGRRVLLLTALSEPSDKLLTHLRTFDFYDEGAVGDAVRVLSLQQFRPQGLTATAGDLRTIVRQAPADVLLGIRYGLSGVRHRRRIEAIKVRGGASLPGLHPLHVDGSGVSVQPLLETRTAGPGPSVAPSAARAGTGLTELDALRRGGLPDGTTAIVAGNLGPRLRAVLDPQGGLTLVRAAPVELDPDVVAGRLLDALDASRARRLVLDGEGKSEGEGAAPPGPAG